MGYYSDFEIRAEGYTSENDLNGIAELLEGISGYSFETYGDGVLHSGDRFKWYDHADDLARLSESYPDTVFEMRIVGEDSELWQVYAMNGKRYSQGTAPVWPEVDISRLA